jgi:hypothetical protein
LPLPIPPVKPMLNIVQLPSRFVLSAEHCVKRRTEK